MQYRFELFFIPHYLIILQSEFGKKYKLSTLLHLHPELKTYIFYVSLENYHWKKNMCYFDGEFPPYSRNIISG